jgi:CheY-like chemotaxis protein
VPRVGIEEGRRRWRERTRRSTEDLQTISLAERRVVVVEDNPVNQRLLQRMLERGGAQVEVAGDGPGALEAVRRATAAGAPPDIVITDLHLPGLNGAELARTLRDEDFRGGIVSLSAGAIPDELRDAFDQCLSKPIDRVRLLTTVGRLAHRTGAAEEQTAAARAEREPARGLRVLVVEDTPVNQRLVQHILERAGAETALADNGKQAVELAWKAIEQSRPFDVVLMDIQMPVLDGIEATRKLRAGNFEAAIVAVTANATLADREKCLEAGCDSFLAKPIDRRKLLRMVVDLARNGRQAPARP